jgi:hypothetical protein
MLKKTVLALLGVAIFAVAMLVLWNLTTPTPVQAYQDAAAWVLTTITAK